MLSGGEILLIHRRRVGLSQKGMGKKYDISRHIYGKRERDDHAVYDMIDDHIEFEDLKPPEKCVIYRKRADLTQLEVAILLGLSRYWINQKEQGQADCSDLLKFWEQRQCQK